MRVWSEANGVTNTSVVRGVGLFHVGNFAFFGASFRVVSGRFIFFVATSPGCSCRQPHRRVRTKIGEWFIHSHQTVLLSLAFPDVRSERSHQGRGTWCFCTKCQTRRTVRRLPASSNTATAPNIHQGHLQHDCAPSHERARRHTKLTAAAAQNECQMLAP